MIRSSLRIGVNCPQWPLIGLIGIVVEGDLLGHIAGKFPNLDITAAAITSPQTSDYNCIAYAAGDTTKWWWPDAFGVAFWPVGAVRAESLPAFQQAFQLLGYRLTADGAVNPEFEKIAIFHLNGEPTHAARQLKNGIWTSKLGPWHDITHSEHCLSASAEYGDIAFYMERKFKANR
jgi:hypothetical protein